MGQEFQITGHGGMDNEIVSFDGKTFHPHRQVFERS